MNENLNINRDVVRNILKTIVTNAHTNPLKREVRNKADGGFLIACPICGDSQKNPRLYRGNLNAGGYFKCFNGGCDHQDHLLSLAKRFNVAVDIDTKLKYYEYLDSYTNNIESVEDGLSEKGFNNLPSITDVVSYINDPLRNSTPLSDIKPIQDKSAQYWYLINRGIEPEKHKFIYQANYRRGTKWVEPVIVYLNMGGDKILGLQSRNLKEDWKRNFHVFNFNDVNSWIVNEDISDMEIVLFNKLSYFYGVLSIDFNSVITIFEGYSDAVHYPNSIGIVGVNTDTTFLETNGLEIQYFFDNDKTGHVKSEEKIEEGFSVFLWSKLIESVVEKAKQKDPYYHEYKLSKIKDLSKLESIIKGSYNKLHLEDYFSEDIYDKKYIPSYPKKKYFKYS